MLYNKAVRREEWVAVFVHALKWLQHAANCALLGVTETPWWLIA